MKTYDNLVLLSLVLGVIFGASSGCAFPFTAAKWYYVAEALKFVCISAALFIFILPRKINVMPIVFDFSLITLGFSINQLLKELFSQNPTEPQFSDYVLLISIIIWILSKYYKKLLIFCSKVCHFWR